VTVTQGFSLCLGRMLKRFASGVLASLRSSTGTRPPHHSAARTDLVLLIRRTVRPRGYASGSSLAAALLDEPFEHPVWSWPESVMSAAAATAMPDSSETGETGGKSATRSSKHFSFQSSDRLTRPAFLACLASLAV
jgi:hypothetical protein